MDKQLLGSLELNRIYQRDCIEGMRTIPDDSVDLIIADPPYYKIKGDFDFKWRTMSEYINWCAEWLKECERVLSPQGSLYVYGVELQLEHLAVKITDTTSLEYRNRITLNKQRSYIKDLYGSQENFRRFIPSAEFLLFYTFRDETGHAQILSEMMQPIQTYFFSAMKETSLTYNQIADELGVSATAVKHWFDYPTQPRIPTKDKYSRLQSKMNLPITYEQLKMNYESLKIEYEGARQELENSRYTFNAKKGMTNVWDFEPDRGKLKTKHPTQKPLELCERIISVSSNEGDIVLIPFVGSGSECIASVRLKRNFVGFETEPAYVEIANKRLDNELEAR
jgi:DNA modification methylase